MVEYNKIYQNDNLKGIPLDDNSVDIVITDPPYNLNETEKSFIHLEMLRVCRGDLIVFSPPENQWAFADLTRYLFWMKTPSTKNFTRNYGRFMEMIFLYKRTNFWNSNYHWSNYVGAYTDRVLGVSDHLFEKPESLIERFIRIHTDIEDVVLDPFAGSGTIPRVASRLNRRFIGFDISQSWINIFDNENIRK